jgi:uncharacterized protein YbjT (DUF2867 family)
MSTILVVGASGTVGSYLVPLLTSQGHSVRRATSRPAAAPDQVYLDLTSGAGREEALAGIDALFLLTPPGHTNQDQLLNPFVDAARARGVKKVVLMSAMGANADESAPLRRAERHLEGSGIAYNIIRPNWFMQNFQTFWIRSILEQGEILLPTGTAKGSFIDARDIAAVAAVLLTSTTFDNRDFDLTGEEALNHDEVATILSRASGRMVTYIDIPSDTMRAPLLQAGLPPAYVEFMLLILGYFKAGYAERTTDAVHTITGSAPRRFAQYAHDNRAAWSRTGNLGTT